MEWNSGSLSRSAHAQPLIHRQSQHPEHQMSHHLRGPPDPDLTGAEFVFEPRVHPFTHRARLIALLLRPGELRRWLIRKHFLHLRWLFRAAPRMRRNDRHMVKLPAVLVYRVGVI